MTINGYTQNSCPWIIWSSITWNRLSSIGFPMIVFTDWLPTVNNRKKLNYEAQLTYCWWLTRGVLECNGGMRLSSLTDTDTVLVEDDCEIPLPTGTCLWTAHSTKCSGKPPSLCSSCSSRGTWDCRTLLVRPFSYTASKHFLTLVSLVCSHGRCFVL